jgi:hypothetical protein
MSWYSNDGKFTGEGDASTVMAHYTVWIRSFEERLLREGLGHVVSDDTFFSPSHMPDDDELPPALDPASMEVVEPLPADADEATLSAWRARRIKAKEMNMKITWEFKAEQLRYQNREMQGIHDLGKAYGIFSEGIATHCSARVFMESMATPHSHIWAKLRAVQDGFRKRYAIGQTAGREAMIAELRSLTDEGGWSARYKGWTAICSNLADIGHLPDDLDLLQIFADGTSNPKVQSGYIIPYMVLKSHWVAGDPPLATWASMAAEIDKFFSYNPKWDLIKKSPLAQPVAVARIITEQGGRSVPTCYKCGRNGHAHGACVASSCASCGIALPDAAARDKHFGFFKPQAGTGCPKRLKPSRSGGGDANHKREQGGGGGGGFRQGHKRSGESSSSGDGQAAKRQREEVAALQARVAAFEIAFEEMKSAKTN